jgi:hypothetical protein
MDTRIHGRFAALGLAAGMAWLAGAPGSAAAAHADQGPAAVACPLLRAGTRVVCRVPEDTCDGGLLTSYAACVNDTATDGSPGVLAESFRPVSQGGRFRVNVEPCPVEVTVYRCSCTPLGDYCALGSQCKRTAVIAGTMIPPDGFALAVPCGPNSPLPPGQTGPLFA